MASSSVKQAAALLPYVLVEGSDHAASIIELSQDYRCAVEKGSVEWKGTEVMAAPFLQAIRQVGPFF